MIAAQHAPALMFDHERYYPVATRTQERSTGLGSSWSERDVEADDAAAAEMRKVSGQGSFLTVLIGDCVLVEPSNRDLDPALVAAGYHVSASDRTS